MTKEPTRIDNVAPGTSEHVVELAQRHVFSSAPEIGAVPRGAPRRDLQRVLCDLLESEISAGLQTFPFDTFRVWIGDDLNGVAAEARFEDEKIWKDAGAIAHWLHEAALSLYPESDYARRWRP